MSLVFNMHAKSTLLNDLTISAVLTKINNADYPKFLGNHAAGDYFYAILRDTTKKEIVKINITGSSKNGLSIERGQQGTAAVAWPAGTLIYQDITATDLDSFKQKAVFRTVDYNPNDVLVPAFKGEKVYQSDLELWWMSVAASGTQWRLIAGEILTATPEFSPGEGTYYNGLQVTITCSTSGAHIYYTLDGSDPDENSTLYTGPVSMPDYATTTLKAIAVNPTDRWLSDSEIASGDFECYLIKVATPVMDPESGTYSTDQTVTITCETEGSIILYTIDDSEPDEGSAEYSAPIDLPDYATTPIKAVGYVDDIEYEISEVASEQYKTVGLTSVSHAAASSAVKVWGDGTYLYVVHGNVINAYSYNGSIFTLIDSDDHYGDAYNVWGDGTYVYVATGVGGICAYTFDGVSLTLCKYQSPGLGGEITAVWGDGTYIYAVDPWGGGVEAFTFEFDGEETYTFTRVGFIDIPAGFSAIWGDGTYLYIIGNGDYLNVYSFNGTTFTLKDQVNDETSNLQRVWCDGTYIYVASLSHIAAYTFDGTTLTRVGIISPGNYTNQVWGDGTYLYAAADTSGIKAYVFDGSEFIEVSHLDDGGIAYGVWGDGTYIYLANGSDGIRSYQMVS